ncbi:MAG: isoprenoid biosynthesis glyoxalase ElbB [Microscillaceae bacterium]|nr:isoprenoid biosynthesis glyoxalase ElbB [Microscillaceae bacterium]MDW8460845.1 isoprenoid biosynthesis glyoxalase ElbB [Cytophagales bacterium]
MEQKPKVAVLLSGAGVYDGAEIQESVFALLALEKHGAEAQCVAPNIEQHHVINHLTGEEMPEKRNVLVEAARIARGKIKSLSEVSPSEFDALFMPGGFGTAKNFTKWAFEGAKGAILPEVANFIRAMHQNRKPIAAVCMAPTVVAKALEGTGVKVKITVGTTQAASPYDIESVNLGISETGAEAVACNVGEFALDAENLIVTSPCYMMEASILEVFLGVENTVIKLLQLCRSQIELV